MNKFKFNIFHLMQIILIFAVIIKISDYCALKFIEHLENNRKLIDLNQQLNYHMLEENYCKRMMRHYAAEAESGVDRAGRDESWKNYVNYCNKMHNYYKEQSNFHHKIVLSLKNNE